MKPAILTGAFYVGNGWVAGGCWDDEITTDYSSFPHSLRLAPVSFSERFLDWRMVDSLPSLVSNLGVSENVVYP